MLIRGDARDLPLRDGCVDCVVTSPPYWGLRDYGVAGQIGLEPTPDAYVATLVTVFREVWRVLKAEGTLWLNLGDAYAHGIPGGGCVFANGRTDGRTFYESDKARGREKIKTLAPGLKAKDLIGIPWRVAFALQADGWYLRSDIIWAKKNCMPESVADRPSRSHEYIFLMSKRASYFYDANAIAESLASSTLRQAEQEYKGKATKDYVSAGVQDPSAVKVRIVAKMNQAPARARAKHAQSEPNAAGRRIVENVAVARAMGGSHDNPVGLTRNKRSVWHLATQPYPDAHFATFPEALVEPCILAGCPLGGLVCDPFIGSGTTGAVAERLSRRWVGIDLTYQDLARPRTAQRGLRFVEMMA
jgi:DNA modification methylase